MYSSSPNTELQRAALIYPRTFVLQLLFLYLLCMNKHHVSVVIVTKAIPGKESMPSHIRQSQDQKQTEELLLHWVERQPGCSQGWERRRAQHGWHAGRVCLPDPSPLASQQASRKETWVFDKEALLESGQDSFVFRAQAIFSNSTVPRFFLKHEDRVPQGNHHTDAIIMRK